MTPLYNSFNALLDYAKEVTTNQLIWAAKNGYVQTVKLILAIPGNSTFAAGRNNLALRMAMKNGHTEVVKLLLGVDAVKAKAMLKDYKEELPILAKMILPDPDKWTQFEEIPDRSITEEELSFHAKIKLLTEFKEIPVGSMTNDNKVIFNQDGYDIGYKWEKKYIKGQALTLADGTPIGYNIFLPEGEVKAIMIEVYGGAPDSTFLYRPDRGLDHFLLRQQGIAIINLNLVDLLKLKTDQTEMPENIHKTLHESIDHFFKIIKHSPEILDQNLTVLKGKPCYLFGCSFGGRTAVRQAELYPNSFDGYISFEGALSLIKLYETSKMLKDENLVETQNAEQWLCPTKNIDKLQAPILLLQNADDNNVTMKSALDFVEKAKRAGKQDFIRLHITDHGGRKIDVPSIEHGHSLPNNKQSFERMASTVSSFILNGPSALTAVSDWRLHKHNILADKDNPLATIIDEFVSLAFLRYKASAEKSNVTEFSAASLLSDEPDTANRCWQTFYQPLLRVLNYIQKIKNDKDAYQKCISNLKNTAISDEMMTRALNPHFKQFLQFYSDKYRQECWVEPDPDADAQAVIKDKAFIEGFKSLIVDGNTFRKDIRENHLYLLTIFLMANPELIGEVQEQVNDSDEARRCLMDEIIREKANIRQVWQQAIHQVVTMNRESDNTCYSHETFDDSAPTVLHKRKAEIDHDAKRQRISDREIELSSNAQKRIMNDKQSAAKRVRSG